MSKYLYGAAVQGIQDFIFQTNKLSEIVGASELVEEICTKKFVEVMSGNDKISVKEAQEILINDSKAILHAAGNVKYIFSSEDACKNMIRVFPKVVQEFAPGITFSQAVVDMTKKEFSDYSDAVNELEKRLKVQRNRPMRSQTLGLIGIERSRQTGLPVVDYEGDDHIDLVQKQKYKMNKTVQRMCKVAFNNEDLNLGNVCLDIEDMVKVGQNDWVAVIHADVNGLGKVVQAIDALGGDKEINFKNFSEALDKATKTAAQKAYKFLVKDCDYGWEKIPIRPLVLSGDDFTVICRADLALDYITKFLQEVENETKFITQYCPKMPNLTACAGIAYVKSSFPFFFAYNLAEELCSKAKKESERKSSCLMFHKVQDSFVESYSDIIERELTPYKNGSFCFGPYFVFDENKKTKYWSVKNLTDSVNELKSKEGNAIKSHLRQWMSLLHDDVQIAEQKLSRLKSVLPSKIVDKLSSPVQRGYKYYPVYDVLAIHTIYSQKTKKNEQDKI